MGLHCLAQKKGRINKIETCLFMVGRRKPPSVGTSDFAFPCKKSQGIITNGSAPKVPPLY